MNATTARVRLLDGFRVSVEDVPAEGLPRGVQRLIAHLSLRGRPAREAIAGQLWPDVPEDHAHGSLRSALWRLKRVAPGMVEVSAGSLVLAEGVGVDVRELETWASRVLDPRVRGDDVAVPGEALLGELLPGWYEDWVLLERERLRQLRMHALEALADKLVVAGRFGEALEAAHAAVQEEPLRESAHRAVVRVHLAEGNVAEALQAYRTFRDLLARELGVAPTVQMEELMSRAAVRVPRSAAGAPVIPSARPATDPLPLPRT